jgi:hypothetical protein
MQHDVVAAAIRVVNSVSQYQIPQGEDVQTLRNFAPDLAAYPPDELACEIIQSELGKRKSVKAMTATAAG